MRIWKKAISAALSAALIASLTATAAFAPRAAPAESDQTDHLACSARRRHRRHLLAGCRRHQHGHAGGRSHRRLANMGLYISAAGATIISAAGALRPCRRHRHGRRPGQPRGGRYIVLRAPAAPGCAAVSVYEISVDDRDRYPRGHADHHVHRQQRPRRLGGQLGREDAATHCTVKQRAPDSPKLRSPSEPRRRRILGRHAVRPRQGRQRLPRRRRHVVPPRSRRSAPSDGRFRRLSSARPRRPPTPTASLRSTSTARASPEPRRSPSRSRSGRPRPPSAGDIHLHRPDRHDHRDEQRVRHACDRGCYDLDVVRFTAKDAAGNFVPTVGATAVSSDAAVLTVGSPTATNLRWHGNRLRTVTVDALRPRLRDRARSRPRQSSPTRSTSTALAPRPP